MPDKTYDIAITTTGDASGAEKVKQAIIEVEKEAEKANTAFPTGADVPLDRGNIEAQLDREASLREQFVEKARALTAAEVEQLAVEERLTNLITQRQIIADLEVETAQAAAAGDAGRATALGVQLAERKAALQLQVSARLSEEEATNIARARLAAERQITAQAEAQAALNRQLVAQEEAKLLAAKQQNLVGRGFVGAQLQNAGVGGNIASAIGIGVLAATQLDQLFQEAAQHYDQLRIESEKESVELQKQVASWKEIAGSVKDVAGLEKLHADIVGKIGAQLEKLRQLPSEGTKGFIQNSIDAYATVSNALAGIVGLEGRIKTSTDEAQQRMIDQMGTLEKAAHTYEDFAARSVKSLAAISTLPAAEQISALRQKLDELRESQAGVDRSSETGQKKWEFYAAQIDKVTHSVSELIIHAAELTAKLDKIREQSAATTDPAKLKSLREEALQLGLQEELHKKLAKAAADAAIAGKKWTDDETKALKAEIEGPLKEKLALLQKIAGIHPDDKATQDKISALTGRTPQEQTRAQVEQKLATETDPNVRANLYAQLQATATTLKDEIAILTKSAGDASNSEQTRLNLEALLDQKSKQRLQEIDSALPRPAPQTELNPQTQLNPVTPTIPDSQTQGLDVQKLQQRLDGANTEIEAIKPILDSTGEALAKVAETAATGLGDMHAAVAALSGDLPGFFAPVVSALADDLPAAVVASAESMAEATGGAISKVATGFMKAINALNARVDGIINSL